MANGLPYVLEVARIIAPNSKTRLMCVEMISRFALRRNPFRIDRMELHGRSGLVTHPKDADLRIDKQGPPRQMPGEQGVWTVNFALQHGTRRSRSHSNNYAQLVLRCDVDYSQAHIKQAFLASLAQTKLARML